MTTAIDYRDGNIPPEQEQEAFQQLCAFLVTKGKYKDEATARKDARQRVDFLEKADVYADDPTLAAASWERKATDALIAAHNLGEVLRDNDGQLPSTEKPVPTPAPPPSPGEAPPARSITDVFGSIELDIRLGLSREQIITKLTDDGMATDNAGEAYDFVQRQHRKKKQNRLAAAAVIVILSLLFFYLSDLFL